MSVMNRMKGFVLRVKHLFIKPLFDRRYREAKHSVSLIKEYVKNNNVNVVVYDRIPAHYSFSKGIVEELRNVQSVVLVVGDSQHPLLKMAAPSGVRVFYVDKEFEFFMGKIECKFFLTFASSLSFLVKPSPSVFIHMFHSLASLHYIYSDYEFDSYDVFFASGPHHRKELERISNVRGWFGKKIVNVGYNKVDELYCESKKFVFRKESTKVVLLAPSWGENNLLRLYGVDVVNAAIKQGLQIIVRPHPHSFQYDKDIISEILSISHSFPDLCVIDEGASGNNSLLKADVMISDWSGVAFEFAFGTGNPVIFMDVPRKINSNELMNIQLPAMEDVCRNEVGLISNMQNIEKDMIRMINEHEVWRDRIMKVRDRYVYNFGGSAKFAARYINEINTD